jgi:acyl-CoA reductase-like NAD-dependent aldehyde dehydrogenase
VIAVVEPATAEVMAEVPRAGVEETDAAVLRAREAYPAWRALTPEQRAAALHRLAGVLEDRLEELARLEARNGGKPISDARAEMAMVVDTFRYYAGAPQRLLGDTIPVAGGVDMTFREPLGVVGLIVPWNFPLVIASWKVAPALAAGNTVVLKPAEQAPTSCLRLAELFMEAGGPPGVFNVVNGLGEVAGKALALHGDVAKVTFTGSTEVGKLILQYAGQSNMKRVALECGGKSPQVFMADVQDLDRAVTAAYKGIFSNMGEVCNAGSRLLVERSIHDEFVERFMALGSDAYQPGDPLDPATNMGPLVTRDAQQRVLRLVETGQREGARLQFGGGAPRGLESGAYVSPTLFTGVRNDMTIARQEIFGPVAAVISFDGADEAIAIANDTIYGLAAGVWTRDVDTAFRLVREIEAGVIWINSFDEGDMTQPFGGYKQSGNTRDKCFESIKSYTQTKSAWFRLSQP